MRSLLQYINEDIFNIDKIPYEIGDIFIDDFKIIDINKKGVIISGPLKNILIINKNNIKSIYNLCERFNTNNIIIDQGRLEIYIEGELDFRNIQLSIDDFVTIYNNKGKLKNLKISGNKYSGSSMEIYNDKSITKMNNFLSVNIECNSCIIYHGFPSNKTNIKCNNLHLFIQDCISRNDWGILCDLYEIEQYESIFKYFNLDPDNIKFEFVLRNDSSSQIPYLNFYNKGYKWSNKLH